KKLEPLDPLLDSQGRPLAVPLSTADWGRLTPQALARAGLETPVRPAVDGMKIGV
ncbi:MAG: hypothetical protein JRJ59_13300, partial [Deltaproteobacteria bacterium]|nr:hypothetical protein [Deltaproteobacteria bacterium]